MKLFNYQGKWVPRTVEVPWVSSMHRGYTSTTVAENTLAAFHRAYLNGAEWIEVDARLTSDNVYVCLHNPTVTVGGVTYTVANETASTITSLVLSHDSVYGDCCIPTLESVLKLCAYTGMCANVDCKAIDPSTLAKLVVDCCMSGRVSYANTTYVNATTILGVDPNAGFVIPYSSLSSWSAAAGLNYWNKSKTYVWEPTITYEMLEAVRAVGFKYMLTSVTSTTNMNYLPDMVEFSSSADCQTLNNNYLASVNIV